MIATEQVPTGIKGLDRLLHGGLRRGGLHLLAGEPGAGKSVLAHQIGATHAREGRAVLYLTALVESHETLLSQARSLSFFDPSFVGRTFYYASVYGSLAEGGLSALQEDFARHLRQREPALVILDGLHTLRVAMAQDMEYQRFLNYLQAQCATTGVTVIVISNRGDETAADPMYTVADAILIIGTELTERQRVRTIEVRKLRGVQHLSGSHRLEISADGIQIHPRLEAVVSQLQLPPAKPTSGTVALGIEGLDAMLGGGVPGGSVTLVAGTPGAGKTSLALRFLGTGVEAGEPCLFIGFHETPDRLITKSRGISGGFNAAAESGDVPVLWRPSSELAVDRLAYEVLDIVERDGVIRLAIDGLDDLCNGLVKPGRTIPFLNAFMDLLRLQGVTVLVTQEMRGIFSPDFTLPLGEISAAVDNVVLLRYAEIHSEIRRLISVLKLRDREHDPVIRELSITGSGIRVGNRFEGAEQILSGLPRVLTEGAV